MHRQGVHTQAVSHSPHCKGSLGNTCIELGQAKQHPLTQSTTCVLRIITVPLVSSSSRDNALVHALYSRTHTTSMYRYSE